MELEQSLQYSFGVIDLSFASYEYTVNIWENARDFFHTWKIKTKKKSSKENNELKSMK